jgi:hypothetical protein
VSDLFSFDDAGVEAQLERAASAPSIDSLDEIEAPALRGIGKGIGNAFMRGSAATADFLMAFSKSPAMSDEQERINAIADDIQEQQRKDAIDFWTPRPNEVGRVGQVLGSLAEIVPPLVIGLGDPALAVGTTTLKSGKGLVDEGVDSTTAGGVAAIEGASTYLGFKAPIAGKTLTTRLTTGAAGNAIVGSASRAAAGETLEAQGYDAQAEKYDQDLATLSTDVLMGMLFGATHHVLAPGEAPSINPDLTPSQVDAVLTARNAKSFAQDTTPGAPDGLSTEVAHQEALTESLTQLSRGEEVNVGEVVARHDGGFTDATHVAESVKLAELVESVEPKDVPREPEYVAKPAEEPDGGYSVAEGELTDEQLAAFQGLRSDVQADQDAPGAGGRAPAPEGSGDAGGPREQAGEPLEVFRGSDRPLAPEHFDESALGHASGHPSSGLGVFFTNDRGDAAGYGPHVESAHLDIRNPKVYKIEDFPDFDTIEEAAAHRKKLQAAGHDGIVIDMSHLGGPTQYVAFAHEQVLPAGKTGKGQAEAPKPAKSEAGQGEGGERVAPELDATASLVETQPDTPVLVGYDAEGRPIKTTLAEAFAESQAQLERDTADAQAYEAAINCFLGRGG